MNPYLFIVGCPRSGTTLLSRMGDAHRDLAIIRELHWLPRWWEQGHHLTNGGIVTAGLVARIRKHSHFARLAIDEVDLDTLLRGNPSIHYARFVSELFNLHGRATGKRFVGEKSPDYVRYLRTLHALWPHARVVHLIRDGRDVALSLLDWSRADRGAGRFSTWSDDPVSTAAIFWECHVRLGREAAEFIGPAQYHELRYELLVTDPDRECRTLCDFLGLAYDPAMLRFHEGHMRSRKPGPRLPVTRGLRNWRDQMGPDDLRRFEAIAGTLLEDLGYDRGHPGHDDEEIGQAEGVRRAFVDDARARGWRLPLVWGGVRA